MVKVLNITNKINLTSCNSVDHILQNTLNNFLGFLLIVLGLLILILDGLLGS